jgi:hypothetical protein
MNNKFTIQQPVAKAVVFQNNDFNKIDVVNIESDQPLPEVGDIVEYDKYDSFDNAQQPTRVAGVVKIIQTPC